MVQYSLDIGSGFIDELPCSKEHVYKPRCMLVAHLDSIKGMNTDAWTQIFFTPFPNREVRMINVINLPRAPM